MQRSTSVVLLLTGLVLIIMVSVYLVLMEFQKKAALSALNPCSYIPADAGMVYRVNHLTDLTASFGFNNPFPDEILDLLPLNRFRRLMVKADSVYDTGKGSLMVSDNTSLIISWHDIHKPGESKWLFVLALHHRSKAEKTALQIAEYLYPDSPIQRSDTANQTLFSISRYENAGPLHFTNEKNFLIISSDKNLIFKSLLAGRSNTGLTETHSAFAEILAHSPNEENRLFVEPSLFCGFFSDYFFWDHPLIIDCSIVSGWMSLKVTSEKKTPGFDGFMFTHRHAPGIFSALNFQEPAGTDIRKLFPSNPSLVYYHHLPDTELFGQDFRFILQQHKEYSLFELHKRRFSDVTGISTDSISGYWSGELAMVLPGDQHWQNEDPVVVMGVNHFEDILQHPGLGIFFLFPESEDETGYLPGQLMEISIPGFFQVFTHGLIKDEVRWAIHNDDYIIASAKKENLLKYFKILHLEKDTIISTDDLFLQNALDERHSIMLYYSVPRLLETFEVMFTDRFLDLHELFKPSFPDLGQMIWQFSPGPGDRVISEIRFNFNDSKAVDEISEATDVNLTP